MKCGRASTCFSRVAYQLKISAQATEHSNPQLI